MAPLHEIDAENRISLTEDKEYRIPKVLALKFPVPKKQMMVPPAALISVLFFTVLLICVLIAVVTTRNCQTPDPNIIPVFRDPCEDGWIWYMKKCYYFSTNISEWEKSQGFCASRNASLAVVDWKHELEFIIRFKGSSDHWIGLRRENETRPWLWTNGSNFNSEMFSIVGYSNCVLVNSGRISSASCFSDRHWICNKPDAQTTNPHF
ncbi:C-type lectin domain family 2 member B-like isoform X2 [Phyllobates terribilis]|uniref:C-type lectin domain family 2 member B-like isoform X2 n=1 Tax=Phyllobates terribilis TaxID=111132 RepID=UPI003CCB17D8